MHCGIKRASVLLAILSFIVAWAYLIDAKPMYTCNFLGLGADKVAASKALPVGKATIRYEFAYAGGGLGTGKIHKVTIELGEVEK
jgi:arylsulfatase